MHFIISKSELAQLIAKIQNIIPAKPPVPILANLLVEASNDQLIITATDLTVTMRFYIAAKVLTPGIAAIPGKKFSSLVRELAATSLEVSVENNHQITVRSGSSCFKFHGMNPRDYPLMPDLSGAVKFHVDALYLKEMIERTSFAAARDEARFAINGLLLEVQNGEISFVGTDGKRLAKMSLGVSLDTTFSQQYILPIKGVEEVASILSGEGQHATIYLLDGRVGFECERGLVVNKLLSGDYPDYRRVFPAQPSLTVALHREELQALLRQVALFTYETKACVNFSFKQGQLELLANNPELGEGRVSMGVDYTGESFQIAFSPHYFLDILRHSKDETVELALTDPFNPAMITDSSSAQFIIMPMRMK
jgi:DNA polymerase-3 subunit beta